MISFRARLPGGLISADRAGDIGGSAVDRCTLRDTSRAARVTDAILPILRDAPSHMPTMSKIEVRLSAHSQAATAVRHRLDTHFLKWLGAIPNPEKPQLIVTSVRDEPGWDGKVRLIQGVTGPEGVVLAVSPSVAHRFAGVDLDALFRDAGLPDAYARLQATLGVAVSFGMPTFRWAETAADHPAIGEWVDSDDPRIPDWLRLFNGGVLATFDAQGNYQAGVGLKRHNDVAREISVGTDPEHRGQGYATQLVAQAARHIIAEGGVPIYQHGGENDASGRVADLAGIPDRGWHMLEIHPGAVGDVRG